MLYAVLSRFKAWLILLKFLVPHPLIPNFELRVQTDGSVTPKEALVSCCRAVVVDLDTLSREFTKEFELRKIVTGDMNQ